MNIRYLKILAAAAVLLPAYRQAYAQVRFGVKASFSTFNVNGKNMNGNALDNRLLITYNAGVFADIPLVPDYSLQPGIFWAPKGYNNKENNISTTAILRYVEVPVNFMYKPVLSEGRLLLGFGPYFGIGTGGKVSQTPANGPSKEYDVVFKNSVSTQDQTNTTKAYFRPVDAGANFLAGYQWNNGLLFNIHASLGMVNISPQYEGRTDDKTVAKNTGFGVSVGYQF